MKLRQVVTFLIIFCLILSRSPQRLVHPQLWAEDGIVFLEHAFELPIYEHIFRQNLGYLQVLQRILTELSIIGIWYESTPFFMNLWALVIATACIYPFTTTLYQQLIPKYSLRFVLACVIALGGAHHEIIGNITNLHTYLSLIGIHLLVFLFSSREQFFSAIEQIIILIAVFIITISCPYFLTFLPLFLLKVLVKKINSFQKLLVGIITIGCVFQAMSYLHYTFFILPSVSEQVVDFQSNVFHIAKTNPDRLPQIANDSRMLIEKKILIQNFVPARLIIKLSSSNYSWVLLIYSIGALCTYFYLSKNKKVTSVLCLACVFFFLQFFIFRPAGVSAIAQDTTAGIYSGRYFLLTYAVMLLIGTAVMSQVGNKPRIFYIFLLLQYVASIGYWKTSIHEVDYHWSDAAHKLRQLQTGQKIVVQINPPGWGVELTKP